MNIVELIEKEVYQKVNTSIKVKNSLVVGNDTYINSCDFKWLELVKEVSFDGVKYKVTDSDNTDFEYKIIGYVGSLENIKLKNFYFYEGTPTDVTQVFQQKSNRTGEKLPMMWLSFSPTPSIRSQIGTLEPYPHSLSITLYFAGLTDYMKRRTKQHMSMVVTYLDEYIDAVVKAIEGNRAVFGQEFSVDRRPFPIFGRLDAKGFTQNVLDGTNLSAIEVEIDVQMSFKCKC